MFDLMAYRWQVAQMEEGKDMYPNGIAFHQMCAVYHPERRNAQIYSKLDEKISDKMAHAIKHEGIYIFGGQDQSFENNNTLNILRTDSKPMIWVQVQTEGRAPMARFQHSMVFCEMLGVIVVQGGRNYNHKNEFLSDLHLLKLDNMNWIKCSFYGPNKDPRGGHHMFVQDTKLYVFGGYNSKGYVPTDINILELNMVTSKQLYE